MRKTPVSSSGQRQRQLPIHLTSPNERLVSNSINTITVDLVSSDEEEEVVPIVYAAPRTQSASRISDVDRKRGSAELSGEIASQGVKVKIERVAVGFGEANVGDEVVEVLGTPTKADASAEIIDVSNMNDDDILEIGMSDNVLGLADMPHQRETCNIFPFNKYLPLSQRNAMHCVMCYCYVCDVLASECYMWDVHCNAYCTELSWKMQRLNHKNSKAKATTSSSNAPPKAMVYEKYNSLLSQPEFQSFLTLYPLPASQSTRLQALERHISTLYAMCIEEKCAIGKPVHGIMCGACIFTTILLCETLGRIYQSYRSDWRDIFVKCLVLMLHIECPPAARKLLYNAMMSHRHSSIIQLLPYIAAIFTDLSSAQDLLLCGTIVLTDKNIDEFSFTASHTSNQSPTYAWIFVNDAPLNPIDSTLIEPAPIFLTLMNIIDAGALLIDVLAVFYRTSIIMQQLCNLSDSHSITFKYGVRLLYHADPRPSIVELVFIEKLVHKTRLSACWDKIMKHDTQYLYPVIFHELRQMPIRVTVLLLGMLLSHPLFANGNHMFDSVLLQFAQFLFTTVFNFPTDLKELFEDNSFSAAMNLSIKPVSEWIVGNESNNFSQWHDKSHCMRQFTLCLMLQLDVLKDFVDSKKYLDDGVTRDSVWKPLWLGFTNNPKDVGIRTIAWRVTVYLHLLVGCGSPSVGNSFLEYACWKCSVTFSLVTIPKCFLRCWTTGTAVVEHGYSSIHLWYLSVDVANKLRDNVYDRHMDYALYPEMLPIVLPPLGLTAKLALQLTWKSFLFAIASKGMDMSKVWIYSVVPPRIHDLFRQHNVPHDSNQRSAYLRQIPPMDLLFTLLQCAGVVCRDSASFGRLLKLFDAIKIQMNDAPFRMEDEKLLLPLQPLEDMGRLSDRINASQRFWQDVLKCVFNLRDSSKNASPGGLCAYLFLELPINTACKESIRIDSSLPWYGCDVYWKDLEIRNLNYYASEILPVFFILFKQHRYSIKQIRYEKATPITPVSYVCKSHFLEKLCEFAAEDVLQYCFKNENLSMTEGVCLLEYCVCRCREKTSIAPMNAWLKVKSQVQVALSLNDVVIFSFEDVQKLAYFDCLHGVAAYLGTITELSRNDACRLMHAVSFSENIADIVKIMNILLSMHLFGTGADLHPQGANKFSSWVSFLSKKPCDECMDVEKMAIETLSNVYPKGKREDFIWFLVGVIEFAICCKASRLLFERCYQLLCSGATKGGPEKWDKIKSNLQERYTTWTPTATWSEVLCISVDFLDASFVENTVTRFMEELPKNSKAKLQAVNELCSLAVGCGQFRKLFASLCLLILLNGDPVDQSSVEMLQLRVHWHALTQDMGPVDEQVPSDTSAVELPSPGKLSPEANVSRCEVEVKVRDALAIEHLTTGQIISALNAIISTDDDRHWLLHVTCETAPLSRLSSDSVFGNASFLPSFPCLRVRMVQFLWNGHSPKLFLTTVFSELLSLGPHLQTAASNGKSKEHVLYRNLMHTLFSCLGSIERNYCMIVKIIPELAGCIIDDSLLLGLSGISYNNVMMSSISDSTKCEASMHIPTNLSEFLNLDKPCSLVCQLGDWFLRCSSFCISVENSTQYRDACSVLLHLMAPLDILTDVNAAGVVAVSDSDKMDPRKQTLKRLKAFLCCCVMLSSSFVNHLYKLYDTEGSKSITSAVSTSSASLTSTPDRFLIKLLYSFTTQLAANSLAYCFNCINSLFDLTKLTNNASWSSASAMAPYIGMKLCDDGQINNDNMVHWKDVDLLASYISNSVEKFGLPASLLFQEVVCERLCLITKWEMLSESVVGLIGACTINLDIAHISIFRNCPMYKQVAGYPARIKTFFAEIVPALQAAREAMHGSLWMTFMQKVIVFCVLDEVDKSHPGDVEYFATLTLELLVKVHESALLTDSRSDCIYTNDIVANLFGKKFYPPEEKQLFFTIQSMYVRDKKKLIDFIVAHTVVFDFMVEQCPPFRLLCTTLPDEGLTTTICSIWTDIVKAKYSPIQHTLTVNSSDELVGFLRLVRRIFMHCSATRSSQNSRVLLGHILETIREIFLLFPSGLLSFRLMLDGHRTTTLRSKALEKKVVLQILNMKEDGILTNPHKGSTGWGINYNSE